MRINWFKDENHLVYINGATQLAELEDVALSRPGGGGQRAAAASHGGGLHHQGPQAHQRAAVRADLTLGEHIEMGENIFFYMGEMQECYVIYWPDAPVAG